MVILTEQHGSVVGHVKGRGRSDPLAPFLPVAAISNTKDERVFEFSKHIFAEIACRI